MTRMDAISRVLGLVLPVVLVLAVRWQEGAGGSKPPPERWLKDADEERIRQLEAHLRGLDVAMIEVGYRFTELYFAGLDRNWPYAKYQAEKIDLALELALERRPKREASARPFLAEEIPAMLRVIQDQGDKAVDDQDEQVFRHAFERMRAACMKCHVDEQLPDLVVELPERRLAPIRAPR
jgi:hypothetical protein